MPAVGNQAIMSKRSYNRSLFEPYINLSQHKQKKLYDDYYIPEPYTQTKDLYIPTPIKRLKKLKKTKVEPYVPRIISLNPSTNPQPSRYASTDVNWLDFTTTVSNPEKIRRLIEKNGFVIVKDVLNADECKEVIDEIWDSMEKITAKLHVELDRNKPATWSNIKKQHNIRNIYCNHGIAHTDVLWKIRQNSNILQVYSTLLRCRPKDLLVSFDGVSVHTPPEYSNNKRGWYNNNSWYHVDSGTNRQCFQSWVTARDVNPGDYTIGFFVKSHKSFNNFRRRFNITSKKNFYKLRTKQEMEYYEARHHQIRISCPAGSLVVWDSRLLHSGLEPLRTRTNPNHRTVCFVSYGNRVNATPKTLHKRISLYRNRRATTHWTDINLCTIPEKKIGNLTKLETFPLETKMLKSLVGFNESEL